MSGVGKSPPLKVCTYCGDGKPPTKEFFSPRRDGKGGGLQSRCKACKAGIKRAKSRGLPAPPRGYEPPPPPPSKRCYSCGDTKPLNAFHKCSSRYQGVQAKCIECKNKHGYARAWKDAPDGYRYCSNPECLQENPQPLDDFYKSKGRRDYRCKACIRGDQERKAYLRSYNEQNNPRLTAHKRRYYSENRARIRAAQNEYWRAPENLKRKRLYDAAYRSTDGGKKVARVAGSNRRARELNAPGRYTRADIEAKLELQGGLCYYCHNRLDTFDIEHKIPLSRGGSNWPANIALSCPSCNNLKRSKPFWVFLQERETRPPFAKCTKGGASFSGLKRFIHCHRQTIQTGARVVPQIPPSSLSPTYRD